MRKARQNCSVTAEQDDHKLDAQQSLPDDNADQRKDALEQRIRGVLARRLEGLSSRQEKTNETASVLFFQFGIYPSAKAVHGYTQHGSLTDINRDLQKFWRSLREVGRKRLAAPMLPDEIVDQFSGALGNLWDLAAAQARASFDVERAALQDQSAKLASQCEQLRSECLVLERQAQLLEEERRAEYERRDSAEKRIARLCAELESSRSIADDLKAQVDAAERARAETERRFSDDLAGLRAARERDAEIAQGEIQFAKMQIDLARTAERALREQLRVEREQWTTELSAYRQSLSKEREQRAQIEGVLAELRIRHQELKEQIAAMPKRTGRPPSRAASKPPRRKLLR